MVQIHNVTVELHRRLTSRAAFEAVSMSRLADLAESLHVPHLIDVEIAETRRRYAREGEPG